jgi:tetratricopeptide (TPR) repeat protein
VFRIPLICVALILLVLAIYGQTIRHGFVNFDDQLFVTDNPIIQQGITGEGVKYAATAVCDENWHPMTILAHMVDCQLYGAWAGGHHLTCLLLHALGAVLLFLLLYQMTGCLWRSAAVAVVWSVHPLRVESVAWIAELKDVLSGVFFFLALIAYVDFTQRRTTWRYLLVMVLLAFGLMSKPMLVTIPFVLLLLDWWPLERWRVLPVWRLIVEKLPLLALSVADCMITIQAQTHALNPWDKVPLSLRVTNALDAYEAYLFKTFYPHDLCIFYPLIIRGWSGWNYALVMMPLLLLGILMFLCVLLWKKKPYLLLGWLWFLGMLVPVIGIIQVGAQSYADRYTYLPQIGIIIAVIWLAADFLSKIAFRWKLIASMMLVTALLFSSLYQVRYWRDNEILWRHDLECSVEHPVPLNNLAEVMMSRGRLSEAIIQVRRILAFSPENARTHNNLGNILLLSGKPEEALLEFREALRLDPSLAAVQQNIAKVLYGQGHHAEGIHEMQEVLLKEPRTAPIANDLAWMLATTPEDSLRNGKMALELALPASEALGGKDPSTLDTLAAAYAETGDFKKASATARKALRIVETGLNSDKGHAFGVEDQKKNKKLTENLIKEIELYESGKPTREP